MDVSRRRAGVKTSVVAGSVWESRMKQVINGDGNLEETTTTTTAAAAAPAVANTSRKFVKKPQIGTGTAKRKTWKSESFEGPIHIAKGIAIKNCEEQCRELSVSADGIKKISIPSRKGRSDGIKELSVSVDGIDKTPIQGKKGRSEISGNSVVDNGNEKSPVQIRKPRSDIKEVLESGGTQLRKVKSDSVNAVNQNQSGKDIAVDSGIERNSIQLKKSKSEPEPVIKGTSEDPVSGIEKSPPEIEESSGSEESCKEFGVCQEKAISETNGALIKSPPQFLGDNEELEEDEEEEEEEEIDEEMEIEIEIEKKSLDIKEINIPEPEPKPKQEMKPKKVEPEPEPKQEMKPKKVETEALPEQKSKKVEISIPEQKPKKLVNEDKKVYQFRNRTAPISSTVNKQPPPVLRRATIYQNLAKPTSIPVNNEYQNFPETQNKLQNLVDLVMWRDISRSAFVFGIGTFIIISSSYTKDLNVSFISVISYLGLVYLAAIFLYRSLICRGVIDIDDTRYVLGEEEAIWLLKLVLPYLNECLLKIRALFSGDPATTMKLAVLLFVFARCGTSMTIWKMAKLGFFGVFTVPKVCSSYSTQLTGYAKFWIRRFRDAWDSCSHKKAVALAIFTLVWNLSSMVARVWAVFMMFVAVRFYQQSMEVDDWVVEDDDNDVGDDETLHGQKQGVGPTSVEVNKVKKGF